MDELGVEPAWLPESRSRVELSEILAASVGFDGENLRGTFTLTGHPRVFTRLYPFAMEHAQPDLVDWAKELANQTIGRFKNRIFAYGLALSVSVPQSIPAEQLRVARTRKRIKIPVAIGIDDMSLDTWLELDIGPGFKLAEQPVSVNEPALPERSLVLFLEADNTQ